MTIVAGAGAGVVAGIGVGAGTRFGFARTTCGVVDGNNPANSRAGT